MSTQLPAVAASVASLRAEAGELATVAGADADQADRVRLAVSEAVTNAVEHAYASGREGNVQLEAVVERGELLVVVSDEGLGMRSYRTSSGLGLGLALMADACDDMTISARTSGGVEVQMRFALAPPAGAGADAQVRGFSASATRPAASFFSTTT